MITAQQLTDALGIPFARAQQWVDALNNAMSRFDINTPARQAAFLAQIGHESVLLTHVSENLNYSASGLASIFHRYFSEGDAEKYAHRPEAIASRVYANRNGNGNEASGDGWKYRGRGLVQVTFRDNYLAAGNALGLDLIGNPDLLMARGNAALSAAWFWRTGAGLRLSQVAINHGLAKGCNLNDLADNGDFIGITLAINGGLNGLDERTTLNEQANAALA
jgi:putative chitinase